MSAAQLDRDKLFKLLGMLGSCHDGEIAAAGRAAARLVRQAGVTWPEILAPSLPAHVTDLINVIDLINRDLLTAQEVHFCRRFCQTLHEQHYTQRLTQRQRDTLYSILSKIAHPGDGV